MRHGRRAPPGPASRRDPRPCPRAATQARAVRSSAHYSFDAVLLPDWRAPVPGGAAEASRRRGGGFPAANAAEITGGQRGGDNRPGTRLTELNSAYGRRQSGAAAATYKKRDD